jgi:hypothetical protein
VSHRSTVRAALVTAVALAAAVCAIAPASAGVGTFSDEKKDVEYFSGKTQQTSYGSNGLDIYSTRIRYTDGKLVIRNTFRNLTRCNTERLTQCSPWRPSQYVYLDTTPDPDDAMYQDEYFAYYFDHHVGLSDYTARRSCPGLRWRSDLRRETSTFVVPRSCLGHGDRHRVRVRVMVFDHGRNHPRTSSADLISDSLDWTPWITYG